MSDQGAVVDVDIVEGYEANNLNTLKVNEYSGRHILSVICNDLWEEIYNTIYYLETCHPWPLGLNLSMKAWRTRRSQTSVTMSMPQREEGTSGVKPTRPSWTRYTLRFLGIHCGFGLFSTTIQVNDFRLIDLMLQAENAPVKYIARKRAWGPFAVTAVLFFNFLASNFALLVINPVCQMLLPLKHLNGWFGLKFHLKIKKNTI